jgi:hypothetical protein
MKKQIVLDGINLNMSTSKNVPYPVNIFISDHDQLLLDIGDQIIKQCIQKEINYAEINAIHIIKSRIALVDSKDIEFLKSEGFISDTHDSPIAEYQLGSMFKSVIEAKGEVVLILFPEIMLHLRMQHDFITQVLRLFTTCDKKDVSLFVFTNAPGIVSKGWGDRIIKLNKN